MRRGCAFARDFVAGDDPGSMGVGAGAGQHPPHIGQRLCIQRVERLIEQYSRCAGHECCRQPNLALGTGRQRLNRHSHLAEQAQTFKMSRQSRGIEARIQAAQKTEVFGGPQMAERRFTRAAPENLAPVLQRLSTRIDASHAGAAASWIQHAAQQLEQGGLAAAIGTAKPCQARPEGEGLAVEDM